MKISSGEFRHPICERPSSSSSRAWSAGPLDRLLRASCQKSGEKAVLGTTCHACASKASQGWRAWKQWEWPDRILLNLGHWFKGGVITRSFFFSKKFTVSTIFTVSGHETMVCLKIHGLIMYIYMIMFRAENPYLHRSFKLAIFDCQRSIL